MGACAPYLEPFKLDTENKEQERSENKARNGGKQSREENDDSVRHLVPHQCGNTAENSAAYESHGHSHKSEFGRNGEGLAYNCGNFTSVLERDAEVAVQYYLFEIIYKLFSHRFIKSVTGLQRCNSRFTESFFGVKRTAWDSMHSKKCDGTDYKNSNYGK